MKIAILANRLNTYHKPMAQSLERMLQKCGVYAEVFCDGLSLLPRKSERAFRGLRSGTLGGRMPISRRMQKFGSAVIEWRNYQRFVRRLREFDCVIIIDHVPSAYYNEFFDDKRLRNDLGDIPIVLYDLIYLCAAPYWIHALHNEDAENGVPEGSHFGLDRYDFHLSITDALIVPQRLGSEAVIRIGIDLTDESLVVRPRNGFSALIDFERPDRMRERATQVLACEAAKVDYRVLSGSYTLDAIRRVYACSSVYFVAHYESFGLPILETQACGNQVFTPDASWCRSHWVRESGQDGSTLSSNFFVYASDFDRLVEELRRIKANYFPERVRETLSQEQPWFLHGDSVGVRQFLDMVSNGSITANSHLGRPSLRDLAECYC